MRSAHRRQAPRTNCAMIAAIHRSVATMPLWLTEMCELRLEDSNVFAVRDMMEAAGRQARMYRRGGFRMSTMLIALKRSSWFRTKYLLFAAIGLMLAYVIPHDESFLVHPKDPIWQHYEPFKWWLLPHGIAGACALLLGPMQFSDRLRARVRQLHRVAGRIYLACVFVEAPLGLYIQYFQERMGDPRSFSIAAAADAALWLITTGIAMVCSRSALQRRPVSF